MYILKLQFQTTQKNFRLYLPITENFLAQKVTTFSPLSPNNNFPQQNALPGEHISPNRSQASKVLRRDK